MAAIKIQATSTAISRVFAKAALVEGEVREVGSGRWMVSSASRLSLFHQVRRTADGTLVCSCEGAVFGRTCWHLAAVARWLSQQARQPVAAPVARMAPRQVALV